jgi:hypothetical protein
MTLVKRKLIATPASRSVDDENAVVARATA